MSAETLRQAASGIRTDHADRPNLFMFAVACWLDHAAHHAQAREDNGARFGESCDPRALAVARTYLGEDA